MTEPRSDSPVGQLEEARCFADLIRAEWTDDGGRRRPLMVVEGGHGHGKTHLLRWMGANLSEREIPYAHLDLADPRYYSDVAAVLTDLVSVTANGLGHHRRHYGRLEFPRLWIALLALRLDLGDGEPGGEREQVEQVLARVRSQDRGSLSWLGDRLDRARDLIPPAELLGPEGAVLDIPRWFASLASLGAAGADRAVTWFRTRDRGRDDGEVDTLVALAHIAREPDRTDPTRGLTHRQIVTAFLCDALRADVRHAPKRVHSLPTPVILLDNAHRGVGPELVQALTQVPGSQAPEPLTVVAASRDGRDSLVRALPEPPDGTGEGTAWAAFRMRSLTARDTGRLLAERTGGEVADDPAERLWGFTAGHPAATVRLVEAWTEVRGLGLHEALTHAPAAPDPGPAPTLTTEERMLADVLGAALTDLPEDLREALTTCSAARDIDAGLWLYRAQDPPHTVGENELRAHPLWDGEHTTVLRRLLLRRLGRRASGGPHPDWSATHRGLADYYQGADPDPEHATESEIYHRLCDGQLLRVAWHFEGWLKRPTSAGRLGPTAPHDHRRTDAFPSDPPPPRDLAPDVDGAARREHLHRDRGLPQARRRPPHPRRPGPVPHRPPARRLLPGADPAVPVLPLGTEPPPRRGQRAPGVLAPLPRHRLTPSGSSGTDGNHSHDGRKSRPWPIRTGPRRVAAWSSHDPSGSADCDGSRRRSPWWPSWCWRRARSWCGTGSPAAGPAAACARSRGSAWASATAITSSTTTSPRSRRSSPPRTPGWPRRARPRSGSPSWARSPSAT
ncbi:hypothetical protein [Nocardiopsis sp. CNR-923]|uniref:hypothetical protein n=1 Tax=Nocardiopsis sp. CNR-923 TaxID=1904965 RepID=UPI0021CC77CD|nr:hypothetical protein [Nocardiopsis sp. CNR-923]